MAEAGGVTEFFLPVAALAIIFFMIYNCAMYVKNRFSNDKRKRAINTTADGNE